MELLQLEEPVERVLRRRDDPRRLPGRIRWPGEDVMCDVHFNTYVRRASDRTRPTFLPRMRSSLQCSGATRMKPASANVPPPSISQ